MNLKKLCFAMLGVIALSSSFALEIPEADGSDGELTISSANCTNGIYTINLGRAATKAWNDRPVKAGCGVYDPDKWAVVFKYTSVRIDEGCTLKFVNHPSNPPVFWLVSGDVVINELINLDGGHGQDTSDSSPYRRRLLNRTDMAKAGTTLSLYHNTFAHFHSQPLHGNCQLP